MIEAWGGRILLDWNSLYTAVIWLLAGVFCYLMLGRRGAVVAATFALLTKGLIAVFWVNSPGPNPLFQWGRWGSDLGAYWNIAIIPFFAALAGSYLGGLVRRQDEE